MRGPGAKVSWVIFCSGRLLGCLEIQNGHKRLGIERTTTSSLAPFQPFQPGPNKSRHALRGGRETPPCDGWRPDTIHLCCTAHKNVISPIFYTNLRLEAPRPVYFSCTTFRHSATTSATLLIRKAATRRWTLRCSLSSAAKRQQFSCVLSTATLSLKLENVFQRVGFDFSRPISK